MLLPVAITIVLTLAGAIAVAKLAQLAMKRLGLELWSVLLWLGLAEDQPSFGNSDFGGRLLYRAK